MRRGIARRPTMDRDLLDGDGERYPEGPAMRRLAQKLSWLVIILAAAGLAAGCGSTAKGVIASLAPSRSISVSPSGGGSRSASLAPTVSPSQVITPTPSPAVTTAAATPSAAAVPPAQATATHLASSPATSPEPARSLLWLWILLGAVLLLGLILVVARTARHRSAAAAAWRSKVIDVYARGAALCDAISVAERPGGIAADDAQARWLDIQRRADDLTQALYALREAAPDEDTRARVAATLAALQAVRSAMDAERIPGGAGAAQADVVRSRVRFFEDSLRALRSPDERAR